MGGKLRIVRRSWPFALPRWASCSLRTIHARRAHNAPSNAAFDASLKERNPSWGVRDIADLERVAEASGLRIRETIEIPANNMLLVFSNVVPER